MPLFEVTPYDREIYRNQLDQFLPDRIIDMHTHVWLERLRGRERTDSGRTASWPYKVARENSGDDMEETYRLMFPGKKVTPLIFSSAQRGDNLDALNAYAAQVSKEKKFPALIYTPPWWSGEELERRIREGGFFGSKVYLSLAPEYIPPGEIRIFDFLTREHLEVFNRNRLIVMLHIPRSGRLRDPVNITELMMIEEDYPDLKLIVAHVGRAYCREDARGAFEVIGKTERMVFDISANTNSWVFEKLIETVGPGRILFGSDLPILRMRMRRICEEGQYINLVPKGLYGDVSDDPHMREVEGVEAEKLTFFMYQELLAFKEAAQNTGLNPGDIENIFFNNARKMLEDTRKVATRSTRDIIF
jgi:uncharacterized protein